MNWIQSLYQTYDNCLGFVGVEEKGSDELLLPLCHTTQNAHIEVTLDQSSNLIAARVLPKAEQKTLVPCTEDSGGRSGKKPSTHPLCDKLQYVAGDFLTYGGIVTVGFAAHPEEPHQNYIQLLSDWQAKYPHSKIQVVSDYVRKGHLIRDLVEHRILPVTTDKTGKPVILDEWRDKNSAPPDIFRVLASGTSPQEAFIRWAVTIPGDLEPHLWQDRTAWDSWNDYYRSTQNYTGLCYVTGEIATLAVKQPKKIHNRETGAKLLSSNDQNGFTFRGRFTDKEGKQVFGISFDVTQKAHNALER